MVDLSFTGDSGGEGRYPRRNRRTPEDAATERSERRAQEQAQRERDLEKRKAEAEEVRLAFLGQAPTTDDSRSDLDDVAYNIHYAHGWGEYGDQCVTAVVKYKSNAYIAYPQRHMLAMDAYAGGHYAALKIRFMTGCPIPNMHAEMYVVLDLLAQGKKPSEEIAEIGVSKPICPNCKAVLDSEGVVYNARWVTDQRSSKWVDPYRHLE